MISLALRHYICGIDYKLMIKRFKYFILLIIVSYSVQAQTYVPTDLRGDTIDIVSTTLYMDLSNYNAEILYGHAVIGIKAKMDGVQDIRLDLLALTVDSVKVNGATVSNFNYTDTVIGIPFATAMNTGDSSTVEVFYHGHPLQIVKDFGGFYWNGPYAFNIGVSFLFDPPNFGKVWFPCFDNFTVKSYMEYYVTTPGDRKAFCNGTLLDVTGNGTDSVWHWKLKEKIPSYLASMSVADYITIADTVQGINGTTPILLAARAIDTAALLKLFVHLHNAFHIHEGHWGAYPWERVGYCIVDFTSGAMEHATNISFMESYLGPQYSSSCEVTMAHELSHHWFGDLVTCNDAAEMWLNESWAVYNQYLFLQGMYGDSTYQSNMLDLHEVDLDQTYVADGAYLPVSKVPFANTYGATVYKKGPDMIRTLRYYMGDSLFFHCMQVYLQTYAYSTATTADLLNVLTQCSGIDLSDYFSDWIMNPGFTHLSIDWSQTLPNTSGSGYISEMIIRQRLKEAPAYFTNVPVTVSYFDSVGDRTDEVVNVSGECTSHTSGPLPYAPAYIAIDFDNNLADAITDQWSLVAANDTLNFSANEFMTMTVNEATGYNLVRVEHNWVRPEPMANKIPGLHLHNMRYWTIDGIIQPGFNATAQFDFNADDVSLDATFITNSEDSMVMMYRANADSEWALADSFVVNTGGNPTDGVGSVTVFGVKRGQYAFAIWNSAQPDTTTPDAACIFVASTGVKDLNAQQNNFRVFPNPANETVSVQFTPNAYVKAELFDQVGRKVQSQQILPLQTIIEMKLNNIAPGYYSVTLTDKDGIKTSKKLIRE